MSWGGSQGVWIIEGPLHLHVSMHQWIGLFYSAT